MPTLYEQARREAVLKALRSARSPAGGRGLVKAIRARRHKPSDSEEPHVGHTKAGGGQYSIGGEFD